MTSSRTFHFTSRSKLSAEYTFQFSPFQGAMTFVHEWNLTCFNVWGRNEGNGRDSNIHLPYNIQLRTKSKWGLQNFGRLYIETREITPTSITVKYHIKPYHPGGWYPNLIYEGKLTCVTTGSPENPEIEAVNTYAGGEERPWVWPPDKNMGGILTLSDQITLPEWEHSGFDFLIPFAATGVPELLANGVHALISSDRDTGWWGGYTVEEWSAMSGVEGFFLADDSPYDVDEIEGWYNSIKARTDKPVGSIFWIPPHEEDRNRLIEMSNFLDFILVYLYPYYRDSTQEEINEEIDYMIAVANDLSCPVMIGAQAMDTGVHDRADPGEEGIEHQYQKYYDAGFSVWWYCWSRPPSEVDIKRNYQTLMNELYAGRGYDALPPVTEFPLESMVYVQASDGVTRDPETAECYIETQSGQSINVHLLGIIESGDNFRKYRGFFKITVGETSDALDQLHMDEFEKAILQVDINGDSRFGTCEIWAEERGIDRVEKVEVFEDVSYATHRHIFDPGDRVYVLATDGYTEGGTKKLRVVAQSGDAIRVTLEEDRATEYKGSFVVTDGPTNPGQNAVHLEPSERAVLRCDVDGDGTSADCQISRSPIDEGGVETLQTYETSACAIEKDTFDWEDEVWVIATNSITTGGTKELTVISDSGDQIHITLTEEFLTRFRGYFKITQASTNDSLNQIHLDASERAVLYCDVDGDGQAASCEIWCQEKEEIDETYATHYRIQVNTQQDMLGTMMWDSQKSPFINPLAPGERSPDIEYAGSPLDLSGDTIYWWRIKFWIDSGAEETPWSTEEAYFSGEPVSPVPPEIKVLAGQDIRKPRGKAEVFIDEEWIDLHEVTGIQISNNKNPLDNIETAQGTVYLSNIHQEFYPDKEISQFFNELFGRKIRMSLGFLDYRDSEKDKLVTKMMGIVKNVNTDRIGNTAEIVALEFMDFYRTKEILKTPVYEAISLSELYCELVRQCFPSWLNQHETADWDYWLDPLGFRRTNVYIGTGKLGGSESIPIRDCAYTPCRWIYSIIPDTEAIYNDQGFRLKRGEDYEIIRKETDKGIESWIHFLKPPYPSNENSFYATFTVDIHVGVVRYVNTPLIEELEKIALVADSRLFADGERGRLICKSNELSETITDVVNSNKNLINLSTRKDIDSITNHVIVESKPYQWGTQIEIGIWEITFGTKGEAEEGKEYVFDSEEPVSDFQFDLSWDIKCVNIPWESTCLGSGFESNFTLPLKRDSKEGIQIPLVCGVGGPEGYGEIRIEPTNPLDASHIGVKFYLICEHPHDFHNTIVFSATLTCHAEGIGQPITYRGEAIDEVSYQDRFIGRRKRTFTLEYLEPGDTQARQAAEKILAGLRKIRTYYDCSVRGMPHLRLMDTVTLTEPKADLSAKKLQAIKLIDSMEVANYMGEIGLMERKMVTSIPSFWETAEQDFIINTKDQLVQTFKFIFDSEIISYKFNHSYTLNVTINMPFFPNRDCHGEGSDENFDLPYTVDVVVLCPFLDGILRPTTFGTLTISLIEETSTSIEIKYELQPTESPDITRERWFWPIDWLGTLSVEAQFASRSPGTDAGDAPPDQPHYPPDEPFCPPEDDPDSGWEEDPEDRLRIWPFTRDMGGILSLSVLPTAEEFRYCGFDFIMPFANTGVKKLLNMGKVYALINSGKGSGEWGGLTVEEWDQIEGVEGYWLFDRPINQGYTNSDIRNWYNSIKARTSKPVGCIFSASSNLFDNHLDIINSLDFAVINMYPYQTHGIEWAEDRITWLIDKLANITVPVIVIAQASSDCINCIDPRESGIKHQFDSYRDAGYPVCWWSWTGNTIVDVKKTYQELMNEFYDQTFRPSFNTMTEIGGYKNNPVIPEGNPGEWDEHIRELGNILYDTNEPNANRRYKTIYTGHQGLYGTNPNYLGYAYSADGKTWVKYGQIGIEGEDPYLLKVNGIYWIYYEVRPSYEIGRASSSNCQNFTEDTEHNPVLTRGTSWEARMVASPIVWREAGIWKMLYEGVDYSTPYIGKIGFATSRNGYIWTKSSLNPVFVAEDTNWANRVIVPQDLIRMGDLIYLFYGAVSGAANWKAGMAMSDDLIHWRDYEKNPIPAEGEDLWEGPMVIYDKEFAFFYIPYNGAGIYRGYPLHS